MAWNRPTQKIESESKATKRPRVWWGLGVGLIVAVAAVAGVVLALTEKVTAEENPRDEKPKAVNYGVETKEGSVQIGDYTWFYSISNGEAAIVRKIGKSSYENAVFPKPTGEVIIPSRIGGAPVVEIGRYALRDCPDISSVRIPKGVTRIGMRAFSFNKGLTSVTIPSSVTNIQGNAFSSCKGLTNIEVDSGNAFYCSKEGVLYELAKAALLCCPAGRKGEMVIPGRVPSDEGLVGSWCRWLKSVFFKLIGRRSDDCSRCVTSIGDWAFSGCRGLTSVTIPSSVTSIGEYAFFDCSLTSITIPSSVTNIGRDVFGWCGRMTNIVVDSGNEVYCSKGGALYMKADVGLICWPGGDRGDAKIPSGVKSIWPSAFSDCRRLTSITIPSSVTNIGDPEFYRCDRLTNIVVDSGNAVYCSRDGALCKRANAELLGWPGGRRGKVEIPKGVENVGERWIFSSVTSLTIPSSVTNFSAKALFFNKKAFKSVTISEGATSINAFAFSYCGGLTSVTIPSSVTNIGERAFCACTGLASVTIPGGVMSIGRAAFAGCDGLTSVIMRGDRPNVRGYAFLNCPNLKSIHVPASAKSWAGMKEWQGLPLVFDAE